DSEVLKNIPIVKSVGALAKVSLAIRDKHLLKKLLIFIESLNKGNDKPEEIEKRKEAANNNEHFGMEHRHKPMDLNNAEDLCEYLKFKSCAFLDYLNYYGELNNLLERYDESIEYYDPAEEPKLIYWVYCISFSS
ncbi:MAG TPA: hypothetical protein GX731_01475, partial [Clostridiales bacterium]|nr:hypothetical protein [Clostridiales bacterium]